jgi:hypothetical protein
VVNVAEGIQTPEGQPVNVDIDNADRIEQDFARAMSEPAGDDKQPPKRTQKLQEGTREAPRVKRGRKPADAATAAPKAAPGLSKAARVEGVKGLVQLGAGGCALGARAVKNDGLKLSLNADAITLASSADDLAEAVAATCEADEKFAHVIDRICAVGPYGALISVTLAIGTQVARNHGVDLPGTHAPEDLLAMAETQAA